MSGAAPAALNGEGWRQAASKYGFTDVLEPRLVVLGPSRVAAQIVTGVGFLGAGIIFVRGGSVRGLTAVTQIAAAVVLSARHRVPGCRSWLY